MSVEVEVCLVGVEVTSTSTTLVMPPLHGDEHKEIPKIAEVIVKERLIVPQKQCKMQSERS
jgi:hypothetical protein